MKNFKKIIALVVVVTFFWLIQISAMPLQATTAEANSQEQNPGMVEKAVEVGGGGAEVSKGSILPYVLIGLGVAAVAALLIFVVFKTSYDITGTWTLTRTPTGDVAVIRTLIFTGTKASGTFTVQNFTDTGTYTVDGKNVTFIQRNPATVYVYTYTGTFGSKDTMSGTYTFVWETISIPGTWTATKTAEAASLPPAVPLNNGAQDK